MSNGDFMAMFAQAREIHTQDAARLDGTLHCSLSGANSLPLDCRHWFTHVHTVLGVCAALNAEPHSNVFKDTPHARLFRKYFT